MCAGEHGRHVLRVAPRDSGDPELEFEDAQKDLTPVERKLTTGVGLFVGLLALVMVALPVVQAVGRKVVTPKSPARR